MCMWCVKFGLYVFKKPQACSLLRKEEIFMLEALKNYVKMLAEVKEIEVTEQLVEDIAIALQNDEEIWDIIDNRISYYLGED